jgi:hypothetical protein
MMSINPETISWLLGIDDPGVHYLTLRDIVDVPETDMALNKAAMAAHQDGAIGAVLDKMQPDGYWVKPGAGYGPKYKSTVWAVILLAQLGADIRYDERLRTVCSYMLANSLSSFGQFSYNGAPSGTIDCLQGNLCRALTVLGCDDPRLDSAFEWMARTVTGEGIAPQAEKHNPLRYYAYKCGPGFACGANNKQACAWGALKIMLAFSELPENKRTPLIQKAIQAGVDFFLSVDPATADYPTGNPDQPPNRSWWKFGFPVFYISDILQITEALAPLGYANDPRMQHCLELIQSKQDEQGRLPLEYDYAGKTWGSYGIKGKPNPWVTIRALRVLKYT